MSVVIVGGHDRMVHQYKKICRVIRTVWPVQAGLLRM